MLEHQNSSGC